MDKDKTRFNVHLDLSKAFDTLDHAILIDKLNYYGINQNKVNLFERYLTIVSSLLALMVQNQNFYKCALVCHRVLLLVLYCLLFIWMTSNI